MAEALLRHRTSGAVEVASAGSHPKPLHPDAVLAMAEYGIDLVHANPPKWTVYVDDGSTW